MIVEQKITLFQKTSHVKISALQSLTICAYITVHQLSVSEHAIIVQSSFEYSNRKKCKNNPLQSELSVTVAQKVGG